MNLFSLHGKHFRDDENRLTANLAVMLNEAREGFLPAFLSAVGLRVESGLLAKVRLTLQEAHTQEESRSILDAKLMLADRFVAVIESKVGYNSITASQAVKYALWLEAEPSLDRVLIFVTQLREPLVEKGVLDELVRHGIESVRCVFLQWQQVFSMLRESEGLSRAGSMRMEKRVRAGRPVSSVQRLGYLFLQEVEKMAYDVSGIDELPVGEVEDVVVQVQDRWFMEVALGYNVWFPPSSSLRGLRPTKYVAYYQTKGNQLPSHLSHVARVHTIWRRVSFADALGLAEFRHFFAESALAKTVSEFKNKEGLFHIALTEKPVALAYPVPLGNPRGAQFLTKKRFALTRLLAARTTDDLFAPKDTEE